MPTTFVCGPNNPLNATSYQFPYGQRVAYKYALSMYDLRLLDQHPDGSCLPTDYMAEKLIEMLAGWGYEPIEPIEFDLPTTRYEFHRDALTVRCWCRIQPTDETLELAAGGVYRLVK